MNTLLDIQQGLKAPKNQRNTFGNYSYRSAEDILEALKPLLKKSNATIIISDRAILIGDWVFIEATATLKSDGEEYSATACARHSDERKGMDASQVTGSTSSYARKYALNGLFAIDDTKDADTFGVEVVDAPVAKSATKQFDPFAFTSHQDAMSEAQKNLIEKLATQNGVSKDELSNISRTVMGKDYNEFSKKDAMQFIRDNCLGNSSVIGTAQTHSGDVA